MFPHNADPAVISRHYEVYLYYLLGEIMFCNSSRDYVEPHLIWLARELTAQPDEDISYSWVSVVLADTYRGLCDACRWFTSRGSISGCLLLLQMWSLEYLPTSRPWVKKTYYPISISNGIPDTMRPTMGYRWMFGRLCWMHQSDHGSYICVVSDLDLLNADHVNWDPWTADRAVDIASGGLISAACISDTGLWMTRCLLVYMNSMKLYSPERVQR
jgi:hypothetical protein